jgi:hypothetical protein
MELLHDNGNGTFPIVDGKSKPSTPYHPSTLGMFLPPELRIQTAVEAEDEVEREQVADSSTGAENPASHSMEGGPAISDIINALAYAPARPYTAAGETIPANFDQLLQSIKSRNTAGPMEVSEGICSPVASVQSVAMHPKWATRLAAELGRSSPVGRTRSKQSESMSQPLTEPERMEADGEFEEVNIKDKESPEEEIGEEEDWIVV